MSIFSNSTSNQNKKGTTEGFFFGAPEAEAERIFEVKHCVSFFDDYNNVWRELENGKFIISGRKGTGKSAIAKRILDLKKMDSCYAELIKSEDYKLYQNVVYSDDGDEITAEMIWEWMVLTKFVKMILDKKNTYIPEYKALEKFWKNNSGILSVDVFDIKEVVQHKKTNLSINPIKCILGGEYSKYKECTMTHAPFYRFIPVLRDIVQRVLRMDVYKNIDFILMFDDLDIPFKLNDTEDKCKLLSLIRIAKTYNTQTLSNSSGKVLLFLRDDVSRSLQSVAADTGKIFGSYECQLKWYNHEYDNDDDSRNLIKKFVNRRLQINFDILKVPYNAQNPWINFIEDDLYAYNGSTPFHYLLDFTFYRPRDFINMFKDIGSRHYELPLNPRNVKTLLQEYVKNNMVEISNELSIIYSEEMVKSIKNLLRQVAEEVPVSFSRLIEMLNNNGLEESVLDELLEYNLIIPRDINGHNYYSYREDMAEGDKNEYNYSLPKSVFTYYKRQSIMPNIQ